MLQSIGSQRVGRDLATEQKQNPYNVTWPSVECYLALRVNDVAHVAMSYMDAS